MFKLLLIALLTVATYAGMEQKLDFFQYCAFMNYPVQRHFIHTQDGYNLLFFRVQKKGTQMTNLDKVVYMQHGLVDSSDTFIYNEQNLAPGLILANKGYDVWFGNSRGNKYSSKDLSSKILNFWDFSFQEMGQFDLPAAFKYINERTGRKIHYVGHSQGTLIMFIALSRKDIEVQSRLASFSAMGPVVYVDQIQSKLLKLAAKSNLANIVAKSGAQKFLFVPRIIGVYLSLGCKIDKATCKNALYAISEKNNTVNNIDRMPVIIRYKHKGQSTFLTVLKPRIFQKYDYGKKMNMKKYGTETPPKYELSNIDFPVSFICWRVRSTRHGSQCIKNNQVTDEFSEQNYERNTNMAMPLSFVGKSTECIEDVITLIESVQNE